METNKNELYHYGVKGMRWGQRRSALKLEKIDKKSKKQGWSNEATEIAKLRTKKVNQMSNAELSKVNNRKSLEQNYSRLNPNAIKKGLAIAGSTVAALGTMAALVKYGKQITKSGKDIASKVMKRVGDAKANKSSKAFWNGMRNMTKMGKGLPI